MSNKRKFSTLLFCLLFLVAAPACTPETVEPESAASAETSGPPCKLHHWYDGVDNDCD